MSGSKGGVAAALVATGWGGGVGGGRGGSPCGLGSLGRSVPLDLPHHLEQSLLAGGGRSVAISLQQFSEMHQQVGVGEELGPVRSLGRRFGIAHR